MFVKKLKELPSGMADFIRLAGAVADEKAMRAYVVGGFVRDIFLNVKNFDIDLVIEGDGIGFAVECASRLKLKTVAHRRFGTATLHGLDGFKVDITSARKEIYENPGVLPTVFAGTIEDDLLRRDFTINAMAIAIDRSRFGTLVDIYGGLNDLKMGLVRALHKGSFVDDPTRILRAVRFEQRFDFKIEKTTLFLIRAAARQKMLHHVQKHRLRDELVLIFKEKDPWKPLKRLYELCGFSYIAPSLVLKPAWRSLFSEVRQKAFWYQGHFFHRRRIEPYCMFMGFFFYFLPFKELENVLRDFAFHRHESSRIISLKRSFETVKKGLSAKKVRPSAVYRLLEPLSYEVILSVGIMSRRALVAKRIEDFFFLYHIQRLHVRGDDLKTLGVKAGPHFKKILEAILYAKIDGRVRDKEEELQLARKLKG